MNRGVPVKILAGGVLAMFLAGAAFFDSPMADAAMQNDPETVQALIQQGADVNAPHGDGMTPLHWAAHHGNAELAELLLRSGAEVTAQTRVGGHTPLHVASRTGSAAVVRALLEAGSDPNVATTTTGVTPLHLAAQAGDAGTVAALLRHGASVDVREPHWGQTALMIAATHGQTEAARALLEAGADVSLTARVLDIPRRAAVDREARERRNEVLESFRAAHDGGESWQPTPRQLQAAIQAAREAEVDRPTETPGSAQYRDLGIALIEDRRTTSYEEDVGYEGGLTALLMAAREGQIETALALLDAGADINQPSVGDQTSPLLAAALNGHFDLALELLQRGADPTLASDAGATPLFAALNRQWIPKSRHPQTTYFMQQQTTHLELMEALLEAGADPNARLTKELWYHMFGHDHHNLRFPLVGATTFLRAAHALDLDAMKLLIRYGADPNIASLRPAGRLPGFEGRQILDEDGLDPSGLPPVPPGGPAVHAIHAAAGVGFGEHYGPNNYLRWVPNGWLPAVKYLVEEHGADVNARDHNGYTPLHHAAGRGDNEMIRYLVEKGADPLAVSRAGQTTVDMANSPAERLQVFPETIRLLESMGAINNHNCIGC